MIHVLIRLKKNNTFAKHDNSQESYGHSENIYVAMEPGVQVNKAGNFSNKIINNIQTVSCFCQICLCACIELYLLTEPDW